MRVFVSSNANEMADYRSVAKEVLIGRGHQVVMMEHFPASDMTPAEYCRQRIQECDLFVGLLGICYGSSPPGEPSSFTEIEYREAQALGKPCLVFLTSDDYVIRSAALKGETRFTQQDAFRAAVMGKQTCRFFSRPDELKYELVGSMERAEAGAHPSPARAVDCVILAGGKASRLWPLTLSVCKELLPVGGKPVLRYTIDALRKCMLVSSVTILAGQKFTDQIGTFLSATGYGSATVKAEPLPANGKRQGPLGALRSVLPDLRHDLLVLGGDNLFSFDFDGFIRYAQARSHSANAFFSLETGHDESEYGVGDLSPEDQIVGFREKERIPARVDISTACYLFRQEELRLIAEYEHGGGDRCSLGSFVAWLVRRGVHLDGFRTRTPWFDIGTRHKYLEANRRYLMDRVDGELDQPSRQAIRGPVQIEQGATLTNCSRIGPNVYIGAGACVSESSLEDCIVMAGAKLTRCNIRRSIVGPESHVEGVIVGSLIGKGAHLLAEGRPVNMQGWD